MRFERGRLARARDGIMYWLRPGREPQISQRNLILANITTGSIGNLIGGNFFTGLLLLLQADDAFIGSIAMIG